MIKLDLPAKPDKLTKESEDKLIFEYQETKKEVWRQNT